MENIGEKGQNKRESKTGSGPGDLPSCNHTVGRLVTSLL